MANIRTDSGMSFQRHDLEASDPVGESNEEDKQNNMTRNMEKNTYLADI